MQTTKLNGFCGNCGYGSFKLAVGKRKLAGQLLRCCKKCQQIESVETGILLKKGRDCNIEIEANTGTEIVESNNPVTLNASEQQLIKKEIAKRIYAVSKNGTEKSTLFRELHREIKHSFKVPSYKDIKRNDIQIALRYINRWKPAS